VGIALVQQRIATRDLPGGGQVAYSLVGHGPFLVYAPGWLTHLEAGWALPPERGLYKALARGRTPVRDDQLGCGMSGPDDRPSMELAVEALAAVVEALAAVVEAVGGERFDLLGASLGAAVAATWAADHPERVERLVLYGGWARGSEIADVAVREHVLGLVAKHWGLGSDDRGCLDVHDRPSRLPRAAAERLARRAGSLPAAVVPGALVVRVGVASGDERPDHRVLGDPADERRAPAVRDGSLALQRGGIRFGERDLRDELGAGYEDPATRFPGLVPLRRPERQPARPSVRV
jgi:pimeloyl-ACP methyl ester carboxylesterase